MVPVAELRIADLVRIRHSIEVRTVHAIHPGRLAGTLAIHFTDGSVEVLPASTLVQVLG